MKKFIAYSLLALAIFLSLNAVQTTASAQGTTTFTYQGQLHDTGTNANGNYAMIFSLYDAPAGGHRLGGSTTNLVTLANGLFTVNLDFGAGAFDGSSRWLELAVGTTNGGNFVTFSETLSPRVPVLPAPYALYANTAGIAGQLTNSSWNAAVGNYQSYNNVFGIYASNTLVLGLSPNGVLVNGNMQANHLQATGLGLDGSLDLGTNTIFFGDDNGGTSLAYNGNFGLAIDGNLSVMNSVGIGNANLYDDGLGNLVTAANLKADSLILAGGLQFPSHNGATLTVLTNGNFVFDNNISISALGVLSFPGNGNGAISGISDGLLVKGNVQFDNAVTVFGNFYANGGTFNNGSFSSGTFSGVFNGTFTGTVNGSSDRNLKEKFAPIDAREVLERVATLPISSWNYKADGQTRHIGPMAQDFYAAFNVGTDDKHINLLDEGGAALAAIQGLNAKLKEKETQINALEKRLAELELWVKTSSQK